MALVTIQPGSEIVSNTLNSNFTYLDDRITATNASITSAQTSTISEVNSVVDNALTEVDTALSNYEDITIVATTSGEIPTFDKDKIYSITPTGAVEFTLPTISENDAGKFYQILVFLTLNDISYVTADDGKLGTENYFYNVKPVFKSVGKYNIIYEYDGSDWCVGAIKKGEIDEE